jgi:hypothetical protein
MRYQIAQKVHASTDPHNPPEFVNDRARDVVDLLLLRATHRDVRESVTDRAPDRSRGHLRGARRRSSGHPSVTAQLARTIDRPSALGPSFAKAADSAV